MTELFKTISDPSIVTSLSPIELGPVVLRSAIESQNGGQVHIQNISVHEYGAQRDAVWCAVREAWDWLCRAGILIPADSTNGSSGWRLLSREGQRLLKEDGFAGYAANLEFPKTILHPAFADRVWLFLVRGEFDHAVFEAFKTVEIAVRAAGKFPDTAIGTDLMRDAFNKETGPLTDLTQPKAEREALAHLFAGAIGSYKNPHSHRTVTIKDAKEAQEICVLASHLLRIVDARRDSNA